jgi:hypothetical protein
MIVKICFPLCTVFLGCLLYALILSLPTLYEYFYEEEYDSYEEQSYAEVILNYVISSFQEAFGGLFNLLSKIFFQSVSLYYYLLFYNNFLFLSYVSLSILKQFFDISLAFSAYL